jgi:protein TonB
MRIIKEAPKWNPGKQRGRPVRVKMVLPILFRLEE